MTSTTQEVSFQCAKTGGVINGRFIFPNSGDENFPTVIFLTGDGPKGTKSLSWTNLPPLLANVGIASFLFDFEGLGYTPGDRSTLTVSKGIANFQSAFTYAFDHAKVAQDRIGILASSFGATVAMLSPELVNKTKLVGLKSPASFIPDAYLNECSPDQIQEWFKTGFSTETGYDIVVITDALRHNVFETGRLIATPVVITHGDADSIVPVRQSQLLSKSLSTQVTLHLFPGVSHSYSEPGAWDKMAMIFVEAFKSKFL
jgi:fermentation-respiration switch protein FrsA (DUF1100 family)